MAFESTKRHERWIVSYQIAVELATASVGAVRLGRALPIWGIGATIRGPVGGRAQDEQQLQEQPARVAQPRRQLAQPRLRLGDVDVQVHVDVVRACSCPSTSWSVRGTLRHGKCVRAGNIEARKKKKGKALNFAFHNVPRSRMGSEGEKARERCAPHISFFENHTSSYE